MSLASLPLLAFLFGSPWATLLAAGGAVSIPIVIHLLNRNRHRVVTWAAMRFLLAAQRKNTRRMRVEQVILLVVRSLIVLILVLAMASVMPWAEELWHQMFPGRSGVFAEEIGPRTHKVIVIDGSFSMAAKTDRGTCFERALEAATQLVQGSTGGDGFSVVLMTSPPRRIIPEPSDDARKVVAEIKTLHLPQGGADLAATFIAVEDLLRPEKSPGKYQEREVYFITDLQRSTWATRQGPNPTAPLEKIKARARTVFIDVGQDGLNNLAITNLALATPLATTGSLTALTTVVHNYGLETCSQVRVDFLVGKARNLGGDPPFELRAAGQKFIEHLAPGQSEAVTFEHKFTSSGDFATQVRLEGDLLDLDDVRTLVLSVKDSVPVMLVNGKPDKDPFNQATEWLRTALNPFPSGRIPSNVSARPKVVSETEFHDAGLGDLTPYDALFLCDVKMLDQAEVRRLETHLRRGGGVVFCLGPDVDLDSYNRFLFKKGEGILPARLIGFEEAPANRAFTFYTDEENSTRAPLSVFTGNHKADLLGARFRKYVRVELSPKSRVRKILSFMPEAPPADRSGPQEMLPVNDPALIEWARSRGRVVLFTSTVNFDWTSWPMSTTFPVLIQELFHEVIAGRLRDQAESVGESLEEYLPISDGGLDVVIHTPEGQEATRTQEGEDASILRWADTDVSGIYRASIGLDPREHLFAVNVPTSTEAQQACESDLARTNRDELRTVYPGWDFQVVSSVHDVVHVGGPREENEETSQHGMGSAIARCFLLTLVGLLLAEVVLAWQFGHYSSGLGFSNETISTSRFFPSAVAVVVTLVFLVTAGVLAHAVWTGDFGGFLPDSLRHQIENSSGVPAPASGEGTRWRLEFSPYLVSTEVDPWLAGFFAVGVTILVVLIYLREGSTSGVAYKLLLAGLRVCFVFLTLAVLLPRLSLWFERQVWPDVAIIIDDSHSMSASDHYQDPHVNTAAQRLSQENSGESLERLKLAQALVSRSQPDWLETLLHRQKVKIHIYHLSGGITKVPHGDLNDPGNPHEQEVALKSIQDLRADGESSPLGKAVRQVLSDFRGSSLSAVIMITDGVTTEGEDLSDVSRYAASKGVPLFFVGIGDNHEVHDLYLHDLQVEDTVYVNDRVIFEGQLTGQGYADLTVPVTLREKGKDKVLATQMVRIGPQGKPVKFRLAHQPTEPGEKTYVVEVPVQPDEVQPADNNRIERMVFVRETKLIKVLFVEGSYRWEYQKIKTLLERESALDPKNKTIDLKVLLLGADQNWNIQDKSALDSFPSRAELNKFDVVLFGDVDPKDPHIEGNLNDLADFVRERGGGFLMIAGPFHSPFDYRNTPLRDILPIEILGPQPADKEYNDDYRMVLTPTGRFHPIFRFSPDEGENISIWNNLGEISWYAENYRPKWGAEVLAVHPTSKATDVPRPDNLPDPQPTSGEVDDHLPLIVQQFVGAGRSMFFGMEETWRWGFREDLLRFNQFWIQTIRYLSRTRLGRVELRLDGDSPFRRGKAIKVLVRFPDDAPPPGPDVKVEVKAVRSQTQPDGPPELEEQTLPLPKVEGSRATYEASLTNPLVGEYKFELSSPLVPGSRPHSECRVLPPPGEMDQLRMNRKDMEEAAKNTEGNFYTLAEADQLLNDLPAGPRVSLTLRQQPRLIWNHPLVFAVVLSLVSLEWLLRKRKHLL